MGPAPGRLEGRGLCGHRFRAYSRQQPQQHAGHFKTKPKEPRSSDPPVLSQGNLQAVAMPVAGSKKRDQRPDDEDGPDDREDDSQKLQAPRPYSARPRYGALEQ